MANIYLLTCFMICDIIYFSFAASPYDFNYSRFVIPTEGQNLDSKEIFSTPTNHIFSISYLLFTKDNTDVPCYVEPENQQFDHCKFDPLIQTKILIHGYNVKPKTESILGPLKYNLPSVENVNLIIVNWTKYGHGKYHHAKENAYIVGMEVGKFINYLVHGKGVNPLNIQIEAQGLGAYVAGVAETFVTGLQKTNGLPGYIAKRSTIFITKNFLNGGAETIANNNSSIQYHLYTPEHPEKVCYFEPDRSNKCSFNSTYKTKVLIHGYTTRLLPRNLFASHRGVNSSDIHLIGHSLGAHVAGVAGKQVPNLGRITGLDPAGILFNQFVTYNRLTHDSADFVDVLHTTNYFTGKGYGLGDIGSLDFYPNRGIQQPACKIGGTYLDSDGTVTNITSEIDVGVCNHDIVIVYFLNSIHICDYSSVECQSFQKFSEGKCNSDSNHMDKMGFHAAPIQDLPVESTFYLDTSSISPYC